MSAADISQRLMAPAGAQTAQTTPPMELRGDPIAERVASLPDDWASDELREAARQTDRGIELRDSLARFVEQGHVFLRGGWTAEDGAAPFGVTLTTARDVLAAEYAIQHLRVPGLVGLEAAIARARTAVADASVVEVPEPAAVRERREWQRHLMGSGDRNAVNTARAIVGEARAEEMALTEEHRRITADIAALSRNEQELARRRDVDIDVLFQCESLRSSREAILAAVSDYAGRLRLHEQGRIAHPAPA